MDKEQILVILDEIVNNPKYDNKGNIDSSWVGLQKLRIDTYFRLLGDGGDIEPEVEI
jgi:hypothetical protein